jgi:hypothetical protein
MKTISIIFLITLLITGEWHLFDQTITVCSDGSKLTFPFNMGNLSEQQSNVTENGSTVACTGEIYPPEYCSILFYPTCMYRSGRK